MAITKVFKATPSPTTDTTAAVVTDPTTTVVNHQHKAKPGKGHARALPVQGIDLNTPQRLLAGHVLGLMKTSHSTLNRWVKEGKFPPPDGKQGIRPFWFAHTIRPHVVGSESHG